MKYNYRNKKTNRYITILKRSNSVPRFGFGFNGYGIEEVTTKYIKIELLKDGN
jgi:hypothetical protein